MVAGDRDLCSTWISDGQAIRTATLEERTTNRPAVPPVGGPIALEAGTRLVVLARVVNGKLERLRSISGDCPIDAGGRHVTWLTGVTPASSLEYLRTLAVVTLQDPAAVRRLSDAAVTAIALHEDPGAGLILVQLASREGDSHTRELALQSLARFRGAFGFDYLARTLKTATEPASRRQLVSALARTREPGTAEALRPLARSDADERVRSEALYAYATLAPSPAEPTAMVASDKSKDVRSRGISGLLQRSSHDAITPLVSLARTTTDIELKKDIVRGLSRVDDAQAVTFLEELVKR